MKPGVPQWRIWIVTLLAALWGILALYTLSRGDWAVFALSVPLFLWNLYQLWVFTRPPRS